MRGKRNMGKRFAAVLAAAVLALSMFSGIAVMSVAADTVVEEGNCGASGSNVKYRITRLDSGVYHMEISGKGFMADFGTGADNSAPWSKSSYADSVKSVTVTKGVLSVGEFSFYNMTNLDTAVLAEGIEKIGQYAFYKTGLTKIRIPSTVKTIGKMAFNDTKLTVVTLPASLQILDYGAIGGTGIGIDNSRIYYPGSEEDFEKVSKNGYNAYLSINSDGVHFNQVDPDYGSEGNTEPTFNRDDDASSGSSFVDVPDNAYYKDAVNWAKSEGITSGVDTNRFGVGEYVTRAQASTFLYQYKKATASSTASGFSDVSASKWYAKYVTWMAKQGYASGYGDGRFGPEDTVTRAQAVTFLRNMENGSGGTATFNDVPKGSWFYASVSWAVSKNITSGTGNGNFSPNQNCTREQFVMFLYKLSQTR